MPDQLSWMYWERLSMAEEYIESNETIKGLATDVHQPHVSIEEPTTEEEDWRRFSVPHYKQFKKGTDICLDLRLKPDVGIVIRARLNLLLARAYQPAGGALVFAHECLDLLDLYEQKEDNRLDDDDGSSRELFAKLQDAAKDIIDDCERHRLAKARVEQEEAAKKQDLDSGIAQLQIASPIKQGPQKTPIVWKRTATPEQIAALAERNKKNPPFVVEGYLRRGMGYKPYEKYVPFSRHGGRDIQVQATSTTKSGNGTGYLPTHEPSSEVS
ncbi:hypothetical protein LTR70_005855 [Exophiala xenobiotica]|uniref:Uncharacterized protein n=1 Tax=Lithohypha guttulata TaxID=1690604 RepID=A0ABR0KAX2_9EURO|nr:hypothetical protein LTR24_005451 [Lithohypha guttulata]KAK5317355.1 hypothetical protein LTR70_005855 [Exophiala xenobiotica]